MRLIDCLGAALLLFTAACSPHAATGGAAAPAAAAAVHPVSGLAVIPLSVTSAGKVHRFQVELARSDAEQEKGLMFRTAMGADEGMIFPMSPPRRAAFWMRNTVIPLDIIFIGADHRILNVAANAVPYDERPLPSAGAASGVLELNGGRAAALGIGPGDKVDW
jgi:uncharacterized membrane protein (UPF0127 family)